MDMDIEMKRNIIINRYTYNIIIQTESQMDKQIDRSVNRQINKQTYT